ncbi:hypothetical protein QRB37_18850 [Mycobacterium avium subsp. hominissuis]|uniref:hypothetical protein n=1 Tax=Mycobacterium avium TaxID=1764 RepID=UPI002665B3B9|nr:hypothetical protein [Mycobacterium avium]MDO2390902.1 hypothetical protein [Mycobacterium avium subsp. hominissuis]
MPTNDHQGDEQPPTTAAANDDETGVGSASDETEVVPPLTVATPGLAWSDEDSNAEGDYTWGRTAEKASIILITAAAVAIVLGLLMWLGFYLYGSRPVEWCKSGRVSACGSVVATMP